MVIIALDPGVLSRRRIGDLVALVKRAVLPVVPGIGAR
jgi:hypothetical protein